MTKRLALSLSILFITTFTFGVMTTAVAEPRTLGILDQKAPGWDVPKWFQLPDDKTHLDIGDFKGKVVYLYCFQSW